MANSSTVAAGDLATALQYNDLRDDTLSSSTGHKHDGTNGYKHVDLELLITGNIDFDAGASITGAKYSVGRDADGTNQLHFNVPSCATFEFSVNDGAEFVFSASQADFSNNALANVGASGNDWTQNALTLAGGTASQCLTIETTGACSSGNMITKIPSAGNGNAAIVFREGSGNGDANNMGYMLAYRGASNYLHLQSQDIDGLSQEGDIWRVPDGQTTIDANTTWDACVFDAYCDAALLSPYRCGVFCLNQRREDLISIGVLRRYSDGWIGYNDQRMAALLAGGIYQLKAMVDALDKRLTALGG